MAMPDREARLEDSEPFDDYELDEGAQYPNRRARQIETVAPAADATSPVHTLGR